MNSLGSTATTNSLRGFGTSQAVTQRASHVSLTPIKSRPTTGYSDASFCTPDGSVKKSTGMSTGQYSFNFESPSSQQKITMSTPGTNYSKDSFYSTVATPLANNRAKTPSISVRSISPLGRPQRVRLDTSRIPVWAMKDNMFGRVVVLKPTVQLEKKAAFTKQKNSKPSAPKLSKRFRQCVVLPVVSPGINNKEASPYETSTKESKASRKPVGFDRGPDGKPRFLFINNNT
jgi:hypothetical protein